MGKSVSVTSHNASAPGSAKRRPKRFPRHHLTAEQFRDARVFSGLSRGDAAELVGVSLRTIGHWETGWARPSYAALKLLRVYRHGELVHPSWASFRINRRGCLVTPENHEIPPGDLRWLSLLVRRAAAFSGLLAERRSFAVGSSCAASISMPCGHRSGAEVISPGGLFTAPSVQQVHVLRPSGPLGPNSNTGQKSSNRAQVAP